MRSGWRELKHRDPVMGRLFNINLTDSQITPDPFSSASPNLATSSQRERNVTGVSLDWVLDTAANVNTINAQVAQELELEKVGEAPGGVGASGALTGGDTFLLGDCELDAGSNAEAADATDATDATAEEREENNNFVFMQGLTASALPVASPAAAGLLGLAFFYCFEGGVEFDWGLDGAPSVAFHGSDRSLKVDGMTRVPFESLPVSMLPSVNVSINGVEIPALFDTGSPVTVLNERAAEAAGVALSFGEKERQGGGNFFSKIASNIEAAKETAQATARGDVLALAGGDGRPIRLVRSKSPHDVTVKLPPGDRTNESEYATIGTSRIFVGDLPGLAALGGLGGDAPPAAVLGMDVLRMRPKLVFRARQREIYF
ncbi:hypothetical protein ACHAWF_007213 [Thalassiosira exigua]